MGKRRKAMLSVLIAAVLLLTVFFVVRSFGPVEVNAKQWVGLTSPWKAAIGDYDNDGLNDLAFAEANAGRVTVYKSDGVTVIKQWAGLSGPEAMAIGDYNNDGLNDLAIAEYHGGSYDGVVTVYKSDARARAQTDLLLLVTETLTHYSFTGLISVSLIQISMFSTDFSSYLSKSP
jgi:hypothetical protein